MKALLLTVALAACGTDNVDLTGMYQVTLDVESMPCGTDTPAAMPPAYLKFHKDEFFGATFFTYDTCNDAAGTDCPNTGSIFGGSYSMPVSNGWTGTETFSSSSGGNCSLGYVEDSALLHAKMLVIEHTQYEDSVQLPDAQCTTDEAKKRGKTMPCMTHAHVEATKL